MPTDVLMPQMGESIAEGTIVRWIKKPGEEVERDHPLFEISTDKVDAEIPSPAEGVLLDILVKEGETVPVNSVVARIGTKGEKPAAQPATASAPPAGGTAATDTARAETAAATEAATPTAQAPSKEDLRRQKSSPLVRRIAKEHGVDISGLPPGSGINGRVTKKDILGFIESGGAASHAPAPAAARQGIEPPPAAHAPAFKPGERVEIVPMSVMRKKIAEHMVLSARTSPHVYSVYEVDFHRIAKLRDEKKTEYERLGVKLTYTAFVAKVAVDALRQFPDVNASLDGENIVYKKDINLGIAVALDWGLIVPVVKNADEKNMLGISRAINDLSSRARAKQLKPEEVQGGTFTITNPGIFGALYGMPLINQPQVAILGVGSIDKRAVVIDDAIAIHPTCHITLGYDHRLIDGAGAGRFLSFLKERLENFDSEWL